MEKIDQRLSKRASSSISPPPSKRKKTADAAAHAPSATSWKLDRLTIYLWNVNGIGPLVQRPITSFFKPSGDNGNTPTPATASLRDVLKRQGWPSLFFLQEVKIHEDDAATKAAVEQAVKAAYGTAEPSYRALFSLPSDKHNARGFGRKVYGVCSLIRTDFFNVFVETVREIEWDAEGRFLVCETRATGSAPPLAIFNIYAAPYKDSETGKPAGTRHDRKLQVHKLLQAECRALQDKGISCIVAGDLNIARKPIDGRPNLRTYPKQHVLKRADFEARFFGGDGRNERPGNGSELGFVDTFREVHGESQRGYTYYPRGKPFGTSCDRVDMILVSPTLKTSLLDAGICETPGDRGLSDHVPLWCSLSLE